MNLELCTFNVQSLEFGKETRLNQGGLTVNKEELTQILQIDKNLGEVTLDLARPGEKTRIIHALDTVEPRIKTSGPGTAFPGFMGPPNTVGEGRTHRLAGVAVVTIGNPEIGEPTVERESVIDMVGEGSQLSPLGRTLNLVLTFKPPANIKLDQYRKAVTLAGLKTATFLALTSVDSVPDASQAFQLQELDQPLPRLVYLAQVPTPYFYGATMEGLPTLLIHPNELLDGALVNSFSGVANSRDSTYFLCNNTVVQELYERHGEDIDFAGVILYAGFGKTRLEQERGKNYTANMLRVLRAQGAIMTPNSSGHAGVSFMQLCQTCEKIGINTVLVMNRLHKSPDDPGFTHFVPQANAIVHAGNLGEEVDLPPVDKVIGGDQLQNVAGDPQGSIHVPKLLIYGSISTFGSKPPP